MPYESERENDFTWTRIEMLVALYRETIDTIKLVVASEKDSAERFETRLKSLSLISVIESGVDTSYGEIPLSVLRLCDFVRASLSTDDDTELLASIDVMQNLHDGFAEIQSEAVDLERRGVTSKLELVSTLQIDV